LRIALYIVAQLFEQLTGLVYQSLVHVSGFTHCVYRFLCVLDLLGRPER